MTSAATLGLDVQQGRRPPAGRVRRARRPSARRAGGCPTGRGAARCVVRARRRRRPRPGRPATGRARRSPAQAARRAGGRRAARSARRTDQGSVTWRSSSAGQQAGGHQVGRRSGAAAPAAVGAGLVEVVEDRPGRRGPAPRAGAAPRRSAGPPGAAAESPTTSTGRGGEPQTSASVRAARAHRPPPRRRRRARAGSVPCTSACSTASSSASSPSSARSTDALTTTRAASCEESCGAGVGQVGACLEQRGQLLVRPAAELVGEGARGGRGIRRILRGLD